MKQEIRFKIGEVSKKFGISVRLLRYYDEIELLPPSYRDDNGYRYYDKTDIIKLEQVLLLQMLDFSLQDIKELFLSGNILDELEVQKEFIANKIAYNSFIKDYVTKIQVSDKNDLNLITDNVKHLYSIISGKFHDDSDLEQNTDDTKTHNELIGSLRKIIDDNYDDEDIYESIVEFIPELKNLKYVTEFFTFLRISNSSKFKLGEIDRIEKKIIKFCLSLDSTIV